MKEPNLKGETIKVRIIRFSILGLLLLLSINFAGCTYLGLGTMGGYPAQMSKVKSQIRNGNLESAYKQMDPRIKGADKVLYLQERGRIASLNKDYTRSIKDFEWASWLIEEYRMGAYISLTDVSAQTASIFLNDAVIPYSGYEYEKIFVHTFQIANYLAQGNLEGALVEVRKTQNEQTFALQQREKDIGKATDASKKYNIDTTNQTPELQDVYKSLDAMIGNVKTSFQNGYALALSGVVYEISHDFNNAHIAYKKALELNPYNPYLERATTRTGQLTGIVNSGKANKSGRLVVFFEDGFVAPRDQISIPIFWNNRSYTISLPLYSGGAESSGALTIYSNRNSLGSTALICNTSSLAARALREAYPGILVRQVLRLLAKDQVQKVIQDQNEDLALIVAIASYFIDNADRRSWLTLPQSIQIADFEMLEGTHTLSFGTLEGSSFPVTIKANTITVVRVVKTGDQLYVSVLWE